MKKNLPEVKSQTARSITASSAIMRLFRVCLCCVCFWCLCFCCSCVSEDDDVLTMSGTVQYVDVSGGCWRIVGSDGTNYEPVNLPDDFKKDGLAVRFSAKYREDLVTECMVGRLIELLGIRRAP